MAIVFIETGTSILRLIGIAAWENFGWFTPGEFDREGSTLLWFDIDGHAGPGHLEEVFGVPVGEAEAAVRFGPADLFGFGSAVDAIAGTAEADPGGANGIVRSGGNGEFAADLAGFGGFAEDGGIKMVGGIESGLGNVELANGTFLNLGGDATREMGQKIGFATENVQRFAVEVDAGKGGARGGRGINPRDFYERAWSDVGPVELWIKFADEGFAGAAQFGDEFED